MSPGSRTATPAAARRVPRTVRRLVASRGSLVRSRLALSAVLLLVVAGVSTGTGYRVSKSVLGNGSAYLPAGHGIAHANAAARQPDAQLEGSLATGRQRLEVVQAGRLLYAINKDTGVVSQVDTSRMTATTVVDQASDRGERSLVAGGLNAYVVSKTGTTGSVALLGPGHGTGRPIRLEKKIVGQVADSAGTLWILLADGSLVQVRGTSLVGSPIDVGGDTRLLLTLLHDRPVVVRADANKLVVVRPDHTTHRVPVTLPAGVPIRVSAPSESATAVWLIIVPTRQLIRVDVDSETVGDPVDLGPSADPRYGDPLEVHGRVYAPDDTNHQVLRFDAASLTKADPLPLPANGSGNVELKVDGGWLWINDQYARVATAINPDGSSFNIDKGDGPGLGAGAAGLPGQGAPSLPGPALSSTPPTPDSPPVPRTVPNPFRPSTPPTRAPESVAPSATARQTAAPPAAAPPPAAPPPAAPSTSGPLADRPTQPLAPGPLAPRPLASGPLGGGPPAAQSPAVGPTGPVAPSSVGPGGPGPGGVPRVAVPNVIGLSQTEACAQLRSKRLDCRPEADGKGGGATGSVVDTDPPARTSVQERYIVVVHYRDRITVPGLTGSTVAAACGTVSDLGLTCVQAPSGLAASAAGLNIVTAQTPAAGARVDTGGQVSVTFPNQIAVPQLTGLAADDACNQAKAVGFVNCSGTDIGPAPAGQAPATVVNQTPAVGTGAAPTGPITVQYYGTAQITVPDLTGMSPAAAQAALTSKGLVPAPSPDEVTNQPNVVHSQSPAAATAVASGTQVQYVYEDAAPVPLYLHKRAGDPFYLLSTEASVAGYSNQRSLGNVFPASSPGGGTTAVYRYRCDNVCGSGTTYYFSMSNVASFNPGWVNDGVAFYAYAQPPAGASSIAAMFSPGDSSWVWAVDPSSEHDIYAGRGYTSGNNFTLGYVWP